MQDRPTVHELLGAIERFLVEEIVPATDGRRQFLVRVAANTLRLIDRELANAEAHATREWAGLDAILGVETMPDGAESVQSALRRRNAELCERIGRGDADGDGELRRRVLAHLRVTLRDKLSVTNTAYLDADERRTAARGGRPVEF
jgi:hypothetical protein